jgi:hypothetical protein
MDTRLVMIITARNIINLNLASIAPIIIILHVATDAASICPDIAVRCLDLLRRPVAAWRPSNKDTTAKARRSTPTVTRSWSTKTHSDESRA